MRPLIETHNCLTSGLLFFDFVTLGPQISNLRKLNPRKDISPSGSLYQQVELRPDLGSDVSSSSALFWKVMELGAPVSSLMTGSQMKMRLSWAFYVLRAWRTHASQWELMSSQIGRFVNGLLVSYLEPMSFEN